MTPEAVTAGEEEALASAFPEVDRRAQGVYFTPAPLVDEVLELVRPLLPASGPVAVIDPACGAGAFLAGAARAFPRAALLGLELSPSIAVHARARVPPATILQGDALRGGLPALLQRVPEGAFELWVGNPPYNGTSSVLREPELYGALRQLLPAELPLPKGTSLRDDYAFFLLLAARRLQERPGALAFITSATLLDAFLYAPVREALLRHLALREVLDLGQGAFEGTRVRTCASAWTSRQATSPGPRYRLRGRAPEPLGPAGPEWLLRPVPDAARRLEEAWRAEGEPLSTLVPVSYPGLKTRFDELLVDSDPDRLLRRVRAFLAADDTEAGLHAFAAAHGIPAALLPKLHALRRFAGDQPPEVTPLNVRPFFRYAGERHRHGIPASARAWCYLDRRLIPRGDHRLQGGYDPHRCPVKLVFNARELPLCATVVEEEGCVTAHRHTRFAPLHVPWTVREQGASAARGTAEPVDLGPEVPNLSPRGLLWAERLGGARALFQAVAGFINSEAVQCGWAPAYGASRELCAPFSALAAQL
ncbi:MAG TPA: N-6 DNA methylase [Myxococcales bacterium]|nr:N-6 DNA methylase [Myxococcales bacterium]